MQPSAHIPHCIFFHTDFLVQSKVPISTLLPNPNTHSLISIDLSPSRTSPSLHLPSPTVFFKTPNPRRLTLVSLSYHIPHYLQTHQFLYFQEPKFKISGSGSGQVPFHHLIPDVLTLPWRPTPPTHPHPTVTYGEGYVTMTSTCQLCPSSCPVHVPTTACRQHLNCVRPVQSIFPTTTSQASWQLTLPV